MGCHALLQGIFLTRNKTHVSYVPCIGRQVVYHWHYLGSPKDSMQQATRRPVGSTHSFLLAENYSSLRHHWKACQERGCSCCWVLDKDAVKPDEAVLAPFIHLLAAPLSCWEGSQGQPSRLTKQALLTKEGRLAGLLWLPSPVPASGCRHLPCFAQEAPPNSER